MRSLAGLLLASSVSFLLWRCQFGIELYDELFYLSSSFKLYLLGDVPFADELHNGLRHYDRLNSFLIQPLFSYSVLSLRMAAIFLYALTLLIFSFVCFGKRWSILSALAVSACLMFDYYLMPTWSHNWWCRNMLLLHHAMILFAWSRPPSRLRTAMFGMAGVGLALATIAYNPMIAIGLGSLALLLILSPKEQRGSFWLPYGIGYFLVLGLDVAHFLSPAVRQDWWVAVSSMFSDYSSGGKISVSKPWVILDYLVRCRELWIIVVLTAIAVPFQKIRSLRSTKFEIIKIIISLAAAAYVSKRLVEASHTFLVLSTLVGLGFGGAAYLIFGAKDRRLLFLALISLGTAGVMAMSSHSTTSALFWSMPTLILPFLAFFQKAYQEKAPKLLSQRLAPLPIFGLILFVFVGSIQYQLSGSLFDVGVAQADSTLRMDPLNGIRTSKRRMELIEDLYQLVADQEYVLSLGLPGVFAFGNVRSAVDTTTVHPSFPRSMGLRSLQTMINRQRIPGLVIVEKHQSWSWGRESKRVEYKADNPYIQFTLCAKTKRVASYPEFEAYQIDPSKISQCVDSLTKKARHTDGSLVSSSLLQSF